ncbi:RloB family protein [Neisseriaceae bacterium TC5R-5]|nr:RloB family protein [Neisseriaceae bacterium TC5R-5]
MGHDELHKKRKAQANELKRSAARRQRYDKVLIVCEGEKTEPGYFQALIREYKIHTGDVNITGDCGSAPESVLAHALALFDQEKSSASGPFNRVYCVIDKDGHANYQQVINRIQQATPANTFFIANSVPCIEYWFLLHFTNTTKPQQNADQVIKALNTAVRKLKTGKNFRYTKGKSQQFFQDYLKDRLDTAKTNASNALWAAKTRNTDNPSTRLHELVDYLANINKR